MEISEIDKLANLSRIELDNSEKQNLLKDIEEILAFVDQVQKVKTTDGVEERLGAVHNVMREDVEPHESGVETEALLKSAPESARGYIRVKKIL